MRSWKVAVILVGGLLLAVVGIASIDHAAAEKQPQMHAALHNLKLAKNHLQKASHDKSGHRAKAIDHVNAAIAEVEAGIASDIVH